MTIVTMNEARSGRWIEFGLLILAYVLSLSAWILAYYGTSGWVPEFWFPPRFVAIAAGVAVLVFGGHLVIRRVAPYADPIFYPTAIALTGIGIAMIYRIDARLAELGEPTEAVGQLILSAAGIVLMLAALIVLRDHRWLRRYTYISLAAGIIFLLLPLLPFIGHTENGARLWIVVAGFSYQPAEMAKIFFAIFFAGYLIVHRDNLSLAGPKVAGLQLPRLRHLAPILVAWLMCMGILAFERDFGTALLFFGLFVAMLYVATERVSWIAIGGVLSALGIFVIVQFVPHVQARITVWRHALDADVYDAQYGSYQLVQGWFGMASGGLFGTGFGEGSPTNAYAANSDFIIASLGEELGLVGLMAILSLYLMLIARALKVALDVRDGFGKLLAAGLGFTVALQCFVVVGGLTRVIPLTGLAMPFLALGGSALLTNWIIIGMLLRMSDAARRPFIPASTPLQSLKTGELPGDLVPTSRTTSAPNEAATDANDRSEEDGQMTEVVRL